MRSARPGRIGLRHAAALMALALSFALQATGAGATHQAVEGTLVSAAPDTPVCRFHLGCMLFAGPIIAVDSPVEPVGQCKYADDIHKKSPFVNIVDISAYTGSTRQVEFKLLDSQGQGETRRLVTAIRDASCNDPPPQYDPDVDHDIGVGEKRTFTMPKGMKWLIVYATNNTNPIAITANDHWRLTFAH